MTEQQRSIGVLTSGGDSQGMNAALRATVRQGLARGVPMYAIFEGYRGMVEGGERIRSFTWDDVGGIMQIGGTIIGTARSAEFRERAGRLRAANNLLDRGINALVVIGGDGSLTGANLLRQEWPELLAELLASGQISAETADQHRQLAIVGLVGSIDNDMVGTDMTIGADSALHRAVDAVDALRATAASHQRSFVVEIMGRNCGYLALMCAVAGGADYCIIPENPPEAGWEDRMCAALRTGRAAGRRESIVIVAEGARDREGQPISAEAVKNILATRLGEDTRVTILGHVQRGGTPSAFDRWMSTLVGAAATDHLLATTAADEPQMIGMRYNRVHKIPLMEAVQRTRSVADKIAAKEYESAMQMRGGSFTEMFNIFQIMAHGQASTPTVDARPARIGIITAGRLAPGMNTAVHAATRLAESRGHTVVGFRDGYEGLIRGETVPLDWRGVEGWETLGGANMGLSRKIPQGDELAAIAATLEREQIGALLVIGGWAAYEGAAAIDAARDLHPALNIPMICLPASINNNLPGSELSIGADTALNRIVEALDRIKQSAVAERLCFVVEVMGRTCGYLALMAGLATGAERAYLPEEKLSIHDLTRDLEYVRAGFRNGKRLALLIRSEQANATYTTQFITDLFEEEGGSLFEARQVILGHLQLGGNPSPFDRVQATRLAARAIDTLAGKLAQGSTAGSFIGFRAGKLQQYGIAEMTAMADFKNRRPREQWWLELRPIASMLAQHSAQG